MPLYWKLFFRAIYLRIKIVYFRFWVTNVLVGVDLDMYALFNGLNLPKM